MARLRLLLCLVLLAAGIGAAWGAAGVSERFELSDPVGEAGGTFGSPEPPAAATLSAAPPLNDRTLPPITARIEAGAESAHRSLMLVGGCVGSSLSSPSALFLANCVFRC